MKVFFVGSRSLDGSEAAGDAMEAHVREALRALGTEVAYCAFHRPGLLGRVDRALELVQTDLRSIRTTPRHRALLRRARGFKPDVILFLLGNYAPPALVKALREETGAPAAVWCQDHMGTMGRQYIIGSHYDFVFAKDDVMVDSFRRFTTLPFVQYLPEACNPRVHRPVKPSDAELAEYGCDVATAATLYYYRAEVLSALKGFDLRIWGGVPRYYEGDMAGYSGGRWLYGSAKAACFNAARIVVNTLYPLERGGLNARAFEVAGCGGFQLITHSDAVSRHFEIGKEIETFRDLGELREKVRYYLDHEDERRAIAQAGMRRAHSEHTYEHRLREMLDLIAAGGGPRLDGAE